MISRSSWFARFAQQVAWITGRPAAFFVAVGIIIVWALVGPFFNYSNTWQLVINSCTTIVTFLMVFVIQNTQNRDTAAMHIKLDELIRVNRSARNILLDLEELDDTELEQIRTEYENLAREAETMRRKRSGAAAGDAESKAPPRPTRPRAKSTSSKSGGTKA